MLTDFGSHPADRVPKAELHAHLEGTIHPPVLRMLAARNGISLPSGVLDADDNYLWTDFKDFLKIYDMASSVIRTPRDYYDLTLDYLERVALEGGLYVEILTSPDHVFDLGMGLQDQLDAVIEAIDHARAKHGVETRISQTIVRHYGPARCLAAAEAIAAHPHPYVTGFQMAGAEDAHQPADFRPAYDIAVEAGLRCTAHTGEWLGPASIRETLEALPMVERLGHGVRAIEDPVLVAELAMRKIPFEICPGSNLALGVFERPEQHALRGLWDAGCFITLASDDPPYFHTSLGAEYRFAMDVAGLSVADLFDLTRNALLAGFMDAGTRGALLSRVETAAGA